MAKKVSYVMAFVLGLGMIFLGARFFFSPEAATMGFGIRISSFDNYDFQHIKGIRDIFSGVLLCSFVLLNQKKAVGIVLLTGTIIPVNDLLIVLSKPYNGMAWALPHIIASLICFVFGLTLLLSKSRLHAQS